MKKLDHYSLRTSVCNEEEYKYSGDYAYTEVNLEVDDVFLAVELEAFRQDMLSKLLIDGIGMWVTSSKVHAFRTGKYRSSTISFKFRFANKEAFDKFQQAYDNLILEIGDDTLDVV